jgi:hypothetical protein
MKNSSKESQSESDSESTSETEIKQKLDAYYKVCINSNFIINSNYKNFCF